MPLSPEGIAMCHTCDVESTSEPLPADPGSIVAVLRKVLKYDVVRDVVAGRTPEGEGIHGRVPVPSSASIWQRTCSR
jgi:hypothetical protein